MKTSENIDQISKAMSTAQGDMNPASKSSVNPFFKSTYSNLTQVWDAIRDPLSKNNLSIFQDVTSTQVGVAVTTRLCHASGQWVEFGPLEISLIKKDAQSLGSATSYAKRYALSAALGVVSDEDDDGEAATAPSRKKEEKRIVERPEEIEFRTLQFLESYPEEDHGLIKSYIQKYASHWNKKVTQALEEYADKDKFISDFSKWKKKELAKAA